MTRSVRKSFDQLQTAVRARLERAMQTYSRDGPGYLSDAAFKINEGRHSLKDGTDREVLIQAFAHAKAGVRIYGSLQRYENRQTFLCTEIDTNKKRQDADQDMLRRAAEYIGRILKDGQSERSAR